MKADTQTHLEKPLALVAENDSTLLKVEKYVSFLAKKMDTKTFNEIVKRRIELITKTLLIKGAEYGVNNDRLHNFRVAARKYSVTMPKALEGMMAKHVVSLDDMINDRVKLTKELIDEKLGDNIVYLILLEAVFLEQLENKK